MEDLELIVSVGTSTLNWMRRLSKSLTFPQGWLPDPAACSANAQPPSQQYWIPRLANNLGAQRTNAELDSTRRWLEQTRVKAASIRRVHLIVSDTPSARWVADVLPSLFRKLLGNNALEVERHEVKGLDPGAQMAGGQALVELVRVAGKVIRQVQERGHQPVINGTAGFKAETTLLSLLGFMMGADVFYLHEQMEQAVVFPAPPINWDYSRVSEEDIQFLRRVGTNPTPEVALVELRAEKPMHHLWPFLERVTINGESYWAITPLGELLLQSTGIQSEVDLPARSPDENCSFSVAAKERGHMPEDAEDIAADICRRLPFVRKVQLIGWKPFRDRLEEGVLSPQPSDKETRVVRLQLQSKRRQDLLLRFLLHTTAETDEQWRAARFKAAQEYGRTHLAMEERPREGPGDRRLQWTAPTPGHTRLDNLQAALARVAAAEAEAEAVRAENERLRSEVETLRSALRKEREQAGRKDRQIGQLKKRIEELEARLVKRRGERAGSGEQLQRGDNRSVQRHAGERDHTQNSFRA